MAKKLSTTRKGFAIGLAVVGIAGLSLASAATLGGLTVDGLGSDTKIVAACDSDGMKVGWGTPSFVGSDYVTTDVVLTKVDPACYGKNLFVTITGPTSAVTIPMQTIIMTASGVTEPAVLDTITAGLPGSGVSSNALKGISIVIAD